MKEKKEKEQSQNKPLQRAEKTNFAQVDVQQAIANPQAAGESEILRLQEEAGNSAVTGLLQDDSIQSEPLTDENGTLNDYISAEIQRARGVGSSLPQGTQHSMENDFDTDFSKVRMHTDARADGLSKQLSAKAFTIGSDVFFRQGAFAPGTERGEQTLRHELTHVVQQGGNAPSGPLELGKTDTQQEKEASQAAQMAANPVVQNTLSGNPAANVSAVMPLLADPGKVQRLMTFATFKTKTYVRGSTRGSSGRIRKVDDALEAFHAAKDFLAKSDRLRRLHTASNNYLKLADDKKPKPRRKPGIRELVTDIETEAPNLVDDALEEADSISVDEFDKKNQAIEGARSCIEFYKNNLNKDATAYLAQLKVIQLEMVQKDLDALKEIGDDKAAQKITRNVIKELMGNLNDIEFKAGGAGAARQKGSKKSFAVTHRLEQTGGESERVGSLAHELTHVAVGKAFDNTDFLFTFAKDAPDNEVKQMIADRHKNIKAMEQAVNNSVNLKDYETSLIKNKLEYATGKKLGLYIDRWSDANKISKKEAARLRKKLNTLGLDNTVIEYDSVINQILIYMHMWKVPTKDPLHRLVIRLAKKAQTQRQAMKTVVPVK